MPNHSFDLTSDYPEGDCICAACQIARQRDQFGKELCQVTAQVERLQDDLGRTEDALGTAEAHRDDAQRKLEDARRDHNEAVGELGYTLGRVTAQRDEALRVLRDHGLRHIAEEIASGDYVPGLTKGA